MARKVDKSAVSKPLTGGGKTSIPASYGRMAIKKPRKPLTIKDIQVEANRGKDTNAKQLRQIDRDPGKLKYPDGNPKTQFGITKPGDFYVPMIPYYEYSLAHLQGALKYGHYNWRDDPVTMSTYLEAAKRHIDLFKGGQDYASDTGIHHLAHAMTCFSIIMDAMAFGTMTDDRWRKSLVGAKIIEHIPGEVEERYIEDTQIRVKAIREKWTGFAEKQKAKQSNIGKRGHFKGSSKVLGNIVAEHNNTYEVLYDTEEVSVHIIKSDFVILGEDK